MLLLTVIHAHAELILCAGDSPELYCQRCPKLNSASDYILLLVAVSDARRHRSSALQLLPVSTRDVTPPVLLTTPAVSNIFQSNFTLNVMLNEPGEPKQTHQPLLLAIETRADAQCLT